MTPGERLSKSKLKRVDAQTEAHREALHRGLELDVTRFETRPADAKKRRAPRPGCRQCCGSGKVPAPAPHEAERMPCPCTNPLAETR